MMSDFKSEVIKDSGVSLFLFLRPLALGEANWHVERTLKQTNGEIREAKY